MAFSLQREITHARLNGIGFRQIHSYSDGVILLENGHGVRTFVRPDGTATYPHTAATIDAKSIMLQAGIEVTK